MLRFQELAFPAGPLLQAWVCGGRSPGRGVQHAVARRLGIGSSALTFLERSLFLPRLQITQPSVAFVRHGRKVIRWRGSNAEVHAEGMIALPQGELLDVMNRPSAEGIYEEIWLSADLAFLVEASPAEAPGEIRLLPSPSADLRTAFDRAVTAITARNGVPYRLARHRMLVVMQLTGLMSPSTLIQGLSS
ncbi:MAG TPA: hypothetical protein VD833_08490 [Vicinamibacterales bacterium]|nr:hypothetical protein [Vicinamibacterales bacterium]